MTLNEEAALWARLFWPCFRVAVWLLSLILVIASLFSIGEDSMKAVALAVHAFYFQRAFDGMASEDRRERRKETRKAA